MKELYQTPEVEWEELFPYDLLCDSNLDGSLEDLIDEPLYS